MENTEVKVVVSAEEEMYRDALFSQTACNLSSLVNSLAKHTKTLWELARKEGKGTDFVNKHPVIRLFLEQMVCLNGGVFEEAQGDHARCNYSDALKFCRSKVDSEWLGMMRL